MLVESRFGARSEVIRALRAAMLFENIVEALSLRDGLEQLATSAFDACIVGNTVSKPNAVDFLVRAQQISQSPDCAFIVLARDGDEAIVMPAPVQDCHTLQWPCSAKALFDGIVIAVVKSNSERTWTGVLQSSEPASAVTAAVVSEAAGQLPPAPEVPFTVPQKLNRRSDAEILASLLSGGFADLGDIVARVEKKELGLDATRRPSTEAAMAMHRIIYAIIPAHMESKRIRDFRDYFEGALSLWFVDLCTHGAEIATNNLRHSLFDYARSNLQ